MRSAIIQTFITATLLCKGAHSQASSNDADSSSNALGFDVALDPLEPLGIDTATLPTYLIVASGTVPQITAGALQPITRPTARTSMSASDEYTQEKQEGASDTLTQSVEDDGARMTRITTTLFTVANGQTSVTALTTTVPISIIPVTAEKGSSIVSKGASQLLYASILVVATLLR